MIWIPNETEAWEAVQLISSDAKTVTVKLKGGKEVKIPGAVAKFDAIPPGSLDEDCDNLVNLESFSEGIILHHVRKRFVKDEIYTFVGTILIAVNPYKSLDIYDLALVDKIYTLTKFNGAIPPHVFSIGAAAVYNMRYDGKDQSVLISGESGAGKTEATKKILQFISTVCGSTASRIGTSIENQILDSNPLLESFGNAKTMRNNNSSRFGKYMEVNCDKKHNIKGCNVKAYLLEKSRVVKQGPMERNYHVFYMLLAGATKEMKKNFGLKPVDQFYYLSQSGCVEVERRSDLKEFEMMVFAMNSLNIDQTVQSQMLQCLAAILHLGNLTFAPSREIEGGSRATVPADCRRVATLLGSNPDALERAMCTRNSTVNGETVVIPLTPDRAVDQRDTLAKYVYGKIFDTVVARVNSSLYRGRPGTNIGVLDIFGFEVFTVNSFEQLCINYCNERLQTFFNEIIFEGEMKMYSAEGLPCDDISFQDNIGCVRLIDLKGAGIFAFLDEEIVMPKGSDEKFVSKLNTIFDENAATKSMYYGRNRRSPMDFIVRHFAGDVMYNAKDFMEKNKDSLAESLLEQMQTSSIPMLVTPPETAEAVAAAGNKKKGSKLTLAAKFKQDLDSLMNALRATVPHFIRCVKPNADQAPNKFDANLALNQLKYSGLFEAIRIRKSGYAIRMANDAFVKRYKHVVLGVGPEVRADPVAYCQALLVEMEKTVDYAELAAAAAASSGKPCKAGSLAEETAPGKHWVVGKTRVFIRTANYKLQLEKIRDAKASNCSVPLQKIVRGFIMRSRFVSKIGQMRQVNADRRRAEGVERDLMAREEAIAARVEEVFRNDSQLQRRLADAKSDRIRVESERKRVAQLNASTLIQKVFRGQFVRFKGRVFMCERMLELALIKRDETLINRAILMPSVFGVTSKLIKVYTNAAKKLIMEVLSEAFVSNELLEAVQVGSVELLRDAIRRAEDAKMPYLPQLREARRTLSQALHLRSVLTSIESVLVKCVTVPRLLANVDVLEGMLLQATELGLAGEYQVQDAALRMGRVRNLIQLRDRIRFAVEICSPSKMQSAMVERAKLLRIYGPELLQDEAAAVQGMMRMLSYQQSIDFSQLGGGSGGGNNNNGEGGEGEGEGGEEEEEDGNERLEGGDRGQDRGRDRDKLSMQEFHAVVNEIGAAGTEGEEGGGGASNKGGAKQEAVDIFLPPFVRKAMEEMLLAQSKEGQEAAFESVTKLVPDELRRRFYMRVFKWVVAFASWRFGTVRTRQRDAAQSATQSSAAPASSSKVLNISSISSTGFKSPTKPPSESLLEKSMTVGFASDALSSASPSKTSGSSKRTATSSSTSTSAAPGSPSKTKTSSSSGGEAPFIPFAQRQARSQVAAHEILKLGKKVHHVDFKAKTDTLLNESIAEYDRFKAKLKPNSTFRG